MADGDTLAHAETIRRRYGSAAARDWELLLTAFGLGTGFALFVIVVPDDDAARLCKGELERFLEAAEKSVADFSVLNPDDLLMLPPTLRYLEADARRGVVWLAGVVQESDARFAAWRDAWRRTLQAFNLQRNALMRQLDCPWAIVIAPWLAPLFRAVAPDLWSVRSKVVWITPDPQITADRTHDIGRLPELPRRTPALPGPDPELAMQGAASLRGLPGREVQLARLLTRAGTGFLARGDLAVAEQVLREAIQVVAPAADPIQHGRSWHELGVVLAEQGRAPEAEAAFRRAMALKDEGGATAVSRGITIDALGLALRDQGRASEAEAAFRRALALADEGGATAVSRGITTHELGRALLDQGRASEAEAGFRRALALYDEGGATAVSRGITIDALGRALLNQGRASEAEAAFRRALALADEGGATAVSRGITMGGLGRALLDQGRASEAEAAFRRALVLADEGGDTAMSRGITMYGLGRALLDQGRASEAEAAFRRALALADEGGDTVVSRGIMTDYLGLALLDQGRALEAEAALRRALALKDEGGDTAVSRAATLYRLGSLLLDLGRSEEAAEALDAALRLAVQGGAEAADLAAIGADLRRAQAAVGASA